jgi:hypothetical protein
MTEVPPSSRTSPCGRADATARLRTAQAYLDVAELAVTLPRRRLHQA